jgi:rubrerythrin
MHRFCKVRAVKSWILLAAVCFLLGPGDQWLQAGKYAAVENENTNTLENLLNAYQRESDSYTLYQAFAQKAESEGHLGVAQLFRAAMASIKVQLKNHADAIQKMKGTPKSEPKAPDVHSTLENLQSAIKDASAKVNDFYPVVLQKARAEREKIALRTFNFSKSAAAGQLEFFNEASTHLETWEKTQRNFWVCSVCGNMVTALNFTECPICFNPLDKYFQVK